MLLREITKKFAFYVIQKFVLISNSKTALDFLPCKELILLELLSIS